MAVLRVFFHRTTATDTNPTVNKQVSSSSSESRCEGANRRKKVAKVPFFPLQEGVMTVGGRLLIGRFPGISTSRHDATALIAWNCMNTVVLGEHELPVHLNDTLWLDELLLLTWSCDGAGGKDRQQALSLQVEEMLLLHLKELLLDGNLLGCQLSQRDNNIHQHTPPPFFLQNIVLSAAGFRGEIVFCRYNCYTPLSALFMGFKM